jgi:hypothetical protein
VGILGVINYHGRDHGLYEITVANAIKSLPLHEGFLFILANYQGCLCGEKILNKEKSLIHYITPRDSFHEVVKQIAETIQWDALELLTR